MKSCFDKAKVGDVLYIGRKDEWILLNNQNYLVDNIGIFPIIEVANSLVYPKKYVISHITESSVPVYSTDLIVKIKKK